MCTAHTSMQIMPFIVAEFTHLIIALDRYMSAKHSSWICRPKFSTFSVVAVWIFCAFTVLPLKGYVNYFDLNALFGESFHDQAICAVKTGKETREHNVAFFIALYLIPHATIVYFYSKTCDELRRQMAYEQIPQTVLRPPSRCLSPSSTDETEHASRRKKLNFRKASPDLQFALNVQLRNNAVIFGFCWLPVQMVYALAAAVSAQLFDVLTVCGFLITSLSPIIKSASILINRNVYWDFMAFDGRPPRPPRSVSEERLPHE
ncbi:hypothetical protein Tcan_15909 [Toxocara canis]|nr:hypothetical protein Tcan_15909 [Toxocara canis]